MLFRAGDRSGYEHHLEQQFDLEGSITEIKNLLRATTMPSPG